MPIFFSFIDHRKLDENLALGCDCYLYETLLVVKATISGGQCGTPATLLGVVFGNANKSLPMYFETQPLSDFLCCECLCQIIWLRHHHDHDIIFGCFNMFTESFNFIID